MLLTEDKAKEKWCPHVRFHGTPSDDAIPNRSDAMTDCTRCIASDCMAWRWEGGLSDADFAEVGQVLRGYCGLAGKVGAK